jgi:predicted secreted hydrolase
MSESLPSTVMAPAPLSPAIDGLRTDPNAHTFEWWYFDAQFDDGSTAVAVYNTKDITKLGDPLSPIVSLTITRPDGTEWTADAHAAASEFQASTERCDVTMGRNWARGDLHEYTLHAEASGNSIDLKFTGQVAAWIPGSDVMYFDADHKQLFGWVSSVPFGTVEGTLTYDGQSHQVTGTGYHDHNWGNVPMQDGIAQWYWGRAHVGDFSTIFVTITFRHHVAKAIGRKTKTIFLLAKGDTILTGDGEPLHMQPGAMQKTPAGMEYPDKVDIDWQSDAGTVHLVVSDPKIIEADDLLADEPSWLRYLAKLFTHPYYLRFNASLDLSVDLGEVHAKAQGLTLFELMSFE